MVKASSFERIAPPSSSSTEFSPVKPASIALTNGRLMSQMSDAGGGGVTFGAFAITRWIPDATLDGFGQWLYFRDLDTGAYWSASAQPVWAPDARHDVYFRPGIAEFASRAADIESRVEVCITTDDDVELRRITIANHGNAPKQLELTTYAELVLNTAAADVAHPAFSKLFVQTRYDAPRCALVASRRLRGQDDTPLTVAQVLFGITKEETITHETDRMRFIGRGRSLRSPRVMDRAGDLSGTVGAVLDPVFARRVVLQLEPGEARQLVLALGVASDESILTIVSTYASMEKATRVFESAERNASVSNGSVVRATVAGRHVERRRNPQRAPRSLSSDLVAFNGFGGFTSQGDEYVIHVACDGEGLRLPPLPWSNVVANERAGFIVSETGAGYTWTQNSRENRLTPWYNDPVIDPHGEALWIRDEKTGEFWSPLPGPTPDAGDYEIRHGFGYSRWIHRSGTLEQDTWMSVPQDDPLKVTRICLTNHGLVPRRLSLFSYAQLVLGGFSHETTTKVVTSIYEPGRVLFARNEQRGEFSGGTAFAALAVSVNADVSCTGDRTTFLGFRGSIERPAAVSAGAALDGRSGDGFDPCAAFRASFVVPPGETVECVVLLGEGSDDATARDLVKRYTAVGAAAQSLESARLFWRRLVAGLRIETPRPALDVMVNGWLTYQNLSCRMWGRSAYYQSGGAFGFRDQLQDSAALVYLDPSITRRQILLHAAHQFSEGDVLHWWHPPTSKGIRTRFSDDLLWLPFIATFYARTTGDHAIFDEQIGYVRGKQLQEGEDESFLVPQDAGETTSVYEHCCRAIDRSLTRGAHGLPLMGAGDWNDGMNRVGREGRGESVWLGFFLHDILRHFIPVCRARGDIARANQYSAFQARLRFALNADDGGWDGNWYRRAYYDNGAPLGSSLSDECRIDAIAQAWSVLSGAAPADRARRALDALEEQLVSEQDGIIRLLTPAFDNTPNDPGYIKGYLPGVRENGGQYTHGALWAVRALAEAGRDERAAKLLEMLSPVSHGDSLESTMTYMGEPYVIAADVYGVAPHVGRAGWTWYTGSAGWMYRVAIESILGFELMEGNTVRLKPCIPPSWPGFTLTYRLPNSTTTYEFRISRASAISNTSFGVVNDVAARVDNGAIVIDLVDDAQAHVLEIAFGSDVGRRYEEPTWPV